MTKKVAAPAGKKAIKAAPAKAKVPAKAAAPAKAQPPAKTEAPAPAILPAEIASTPTVAAEPVTIDLNKPSIKEAIAKGMALIKYGKSKADAAMVIFEALQTEPQDVVVAAFVEGATLTAKGAVTYWYNCRRKAKKAAKTA
jgi:hypothetical protein